MPRLVIRKGDGAGKDHALSGECSVGRQAGCTFVIDDLLASRRHFRVYPEGGAWWVEDLGSTNGTIVNGRKIPQRQRLSDGDVISAGNTELVFVQKDLLGSAAPMPAATPSSRVYTPPAATTPAPRPAIVPPAVPVPPARAASRQDSPVPSAPASSKPAAAPAKPGVGTAKPAAPASAPSGSKAPSPPAPSSPGPAKKFDAPVPRKRKA
jgi:predicted component of type VI protein secretion system